MKIFSEIVIALVAIEHLYILWLEMFAWETKGKKVFANAFSDEMFAKTKTMAANQGLYNGFLAAGLIWSFFIENSEWHIYVAAFFLACVAIAGIFGAFTVSKKIFFMQALPALIALALLCF